MNFALVESIKRVLKAKTILGCDVSKEDNVNLFFFQAVFWKIFEPPWRRTRGSIANIGMIKSFLKNLQCFRYNLAALMTIKKT